MNLNIYTGLIYIHKHIEQFMMYDIDTLNLKFHNTI